ncbi:MAG: hypothetical protein ACYDH9_20750 [Limisphaerales bacterium]
MNNTGIGIRAGVHGERSTKFSGDGALLARMKLKEYQDRALKEVKSLGLFLCLRADDFDESALEGRHGEV